VELVPLAEVEGINPPQKQSVHERRARDATKLIPQVVGLVNSCGITSLRNANRNIHPGRPITITLSIRHPLGTELRYARSNARGYRLSSRHHRQQCQNHKNSLHGGEIRLSVRPPLPFKSKGLSNCGDVFTGWVPLIFNTFKFGVIGAPHGSGVGFLRA